MATGGHTQGGGGGSGGGGPKKTLAFSFKNGLLKAFLDAEPFLTNFGVRDSEIWAGEILEFMHGKQLAPVDASLFILLCSLCRHKDRILQAINNLPSNLQIEASSAKNFVFMSTVAYTSKYVPTLNIPTMVVPTAFPLVAFPIAVWQKAMSYGKGTKEIGKADLFSLRPSIQIAFNDFYQPTVFAAAKMFWEAIKTSKNDSKVFDEGFHPDWAKVQWTDHYNASVFSMDGNIFYLPIVSGGYVDADVDKIRSTISFQYTDDELETAGWVKADNIVAPKAGIWVTGANYSTSTAATGATI